MAGCSLFGGDNRKFFKYLGAASKASSAYFPQLNGKTIICNAPGYFKVLYKAGSVFFNQQTLEKVTLCKGRPKDGSPGACKFACPVCAGEVPPFLGGDLDCPPPLVDQDQRLDALVKLSVGARSVGMVTVQVPAENAVVNWELMVRSKQIEVRGMFRAEDSGGDGESAAAEGEELMAVTLTFENGLTTGSVAMPGPGVFVLVFDNTSSRFTSKSVEHRVIIAGPA
jgi:hypothetical protein